MSRRWLSVVIVAILGCGAAAPVASANSLTVLQAVTKETEAELASPGFAAVEHPAENFGTLAAMKKNLPKVEALHRLIVTAGDVVEHSTATSSAQQQARTDWVAGTRDNARAYTALIAELKDVMAGDPTAAKAEEIREKTFARAGTPLIAKATTLLGY